MNEVIKKLKKDNFSLIHETYIDEMGIKRDSLNISEIKDNGHIVNYPFIGKIKIYGDNDNLLDATVNYTDEEYDLMFNEELEKIN